MSSRAGEAHRQADGLHIIAYCLIKPHRGAHVGGGGDACRCRAGSPRSLEASNLNFLAAGQATMADPEMGPIVAWGLPYRPSHR